jgi:ATP/ADP translocase
MASRSGVLTRDLFFFFLGDEQSMELVFLVLYVLADFFRRLLGENGNKLGQRKSLFLFVLLCLPIAIAHVYFIAWQVYVLSVELVINIILLVFIALEFLLAIFVMIRRTA